MTKQEKLIYEKAYKQFRREIRNTLFDAIANDFSNEKVSAFLGQVMTSLNAMALTFKPYRKVKS